MALKAPNAGSTSGRANKVREYVLSLYYVPDAIYFFIYIISVYSPTNPKKKVVSLDLKGLIRIRQNNTQCEKQYQEGRDSELINSEGEGMDSCSQRIGAGFKRHGILIFKE